MARREPGALPPHWTPVETSKLQDCRVFEVSRMLSRSPRTGEIHPFYRIDSTDWVNVVVLGASQGSRVSCPEVIDRTCLTLMRVFVWSVRGWSQICGMSDSARDIPTR